MKAARRPKGQVLVLFTLFLLVLLGVSALAVDYAQWLLTDRALQNVSDHAALAGASQFEQRETQGSCAGGSSPKCIVARTQAWASLNNELKLGLSDTIIACLGSAGPDGGDSPPAGETDSSRAAACSGQAAIDFGHTIWVATPPPNYAAYTGVGGRYFSNYGVVFVRVDRAVRSFLGGALGIAPDPRHGWATAGSIPTDFAFQIFCRNHVQPEGGACGGSGGSALVINGHGGIRLVRGDIGSNESLKVTAQGGPGVVLEAGNMFLVRGDCGASSWNCPTVPASAGGIADADPNVNPTTANNKNAFYIPPQPVPRYESPLEFASANHDCSDATATTPCIPYRDQNNPTPSSPGAWECVSVDDGVHELCGEPIVVSGTVTCTGASGSGSFLDPHLRPSRDIAMGAVNGTPINTNNLKYQNIDEVTADVTPTDWVWTSNLGVSGGGATAAFEVEIQGANGEPDASPITHIRLAAFKVLNGSTTGAAGGNTVQIDSAVLEENGTVISTMPGTPIVLSEVPTQYPLADDWTTSSINDYQNLSLRVTFRSSGVTTAAMRRGGAVSWAEVEINNGNTLSPARPPMIPPGYYESISIDDDGCAVLDPTARYGDLVQHQLPGIYEIDGGGNAEIHIGGDRDGDGYGGFLIGDGVTFVFDSDFQDRGLDIEPAGVLVVNSSRVIGSPPCTPSETETIDYNPSDPLPALPYSSVCAAWAVDSSDTSGVRDGWHQWPVCIDTSLSQCVERSEYLSTAAPSTYRGITFYYTPISGWSTAHEDMDIGRRRFDMQGGCGGSGPTAGIAFRGVLYAPYDDVNIQGGNEFATVGQVLSWTAKFHGCSARIDLDYPYEYLGAKPYLLEPTVEH